MKAYRITQKWGDRPDTQSETTVIADSYISALQLLAEKNFVNENDEIHIMRMGEVET